MRAEVLAAYKVLDPDTTAGDVLEACRELFRQSDEYACAIPGPFDASEVDAVATALFDCLEASEARGLREIVFSVPRRLEGERLEYNQYISMFSEDMLYQNLGLGYGTMDVEDLRRALNVFLTGVLVRYRWCTGIADDAFPVSMILAYLDGLSVLFVKEGREGQLFSAVVNTLLALGALEPSFGRSGLPLPGSLIQRLLNLDWEGESKG